MVQDGHNAQGQEQEKDELETLLREIGERFETAFLRFWTSTTCASIWTDWCRQRRSRIP